MVHKSVKVGLLLAVSGYLSQTRVVGYYLVVKGSCMYSMPREEA